MSIQRIREDILFLAGRIPHRRAASEEEEVAASYVLEQFQSTNPMARVEPFATVESFGLVFALYCAEFFLVFLLGTWFPGTSAGYGTVVFILFLLELAGKNPLSRIIPLYESQNIVAPINSVERKKLVIITANYDTPLCNSIRGWIGAKAYNLFNCATLLAMMMIIVGSVGVSMGDQALAIPFEIARWSGFVFLVLATMTWLLFGKMGEDTRGAVQSASGIAVELEIARRLREKKMQNTDVWLVAIGSGEASRAGIQRALRPGDDINPKDTMLINLVSVGSGELNYTVKEKSLTSYGMENAFSKVVSSAGSLFGIQSLTYGGIPTNAFWAMSQGIEATSIIGWDNNTAAFFNQSKDTVESVNVEQVEKTADFIQEIIQKLDNS